MGRSKLKALKQTTLQTFFDICQQWGLNSEHYTYNQMNNEIIFYNDSKIILKDLFLYPADPNFDSLGSLEITGAFIDEVNQITEKAKNIVASRIRYKLDEYNLIPKLLMSCNPSKNWVYDEFYKKSKEDKLEDYKKFIHALVTDNEHISKHYITQLQKLDEISKKRLLFGQWEYEDKDALINYDNIIDIFKDYKYKQEEHISTNNYYISVDVARQGNDKAVIILWYKFNILNIKSYDKSSLTELKDYIDILKNEYKINNRNIVIDEDGLGGGLVDFIRGSRGFINNSKALKNENYQNLKTQCYYKLAEKINNDEISIFNVEDTKVKEMIIQELSNVKRKNVDKDGKVQIIGKDEIKQLIGRSPDYADAMMMRMIFEYKNNSVSFTII